MLNKSIALFLLVLCFSFNIYAEEVSVALKKDTLVSTDPAVKVPVLMLMTLNGYHQALTKELIARDLDSDKFWAKLEEKKLTDDQEIELLKPIFLNVTMLSQPANPTDEFERSVFKYDLDKAKVDALFNEYLSNLPDVTIKTFYIRPDIRIDDSMSWSDVGVSKAENFSGVIVESWKKWATTQFKNFGNVVVLDKDLTQIPSNMNAESVTLKWNSQLKRAEVFQDRKSARFELTAQYLLVNTKTNQTLVGFDFPTQKREFTIYNPKDLSSNLASLIYNLLNSQTVRINSSLELNRATSTLTMVEMKVTGKHGLFDITQVNSFLAEQFKDVGLVAELKSYSTEASVISVKSTLPVESLYARLAKDGGKYSLNEQKILLFSSENHSFAIIEKQANN
ncbi:hypothetical protein C8D79_3134 [Bacteriovorax stolpii]|nr:hypothetical protein [Bacteriovorax stolpii]TDP51690.1 hypothetical protein C8D79_3134 [Bacteriovorax stolpii]